jgi:hypothetical protein
LIDYLTATFTTRSTITTTGTGTGRPQEGRRKALQRARSQAIRTTPGRPRQRTGGGARTSQPALQHLVGVFLVGGDLVDPFVEVTPHVSKLSLAIRRCARKEALSFECDAVFHRSPGHHAK